MFKKMNHKIKSIMGLDNGDFKETCFVYCLMIACVVAIILGSLVAVNKNLQTENKMEETIYVGEITTMKLISDEETIKEDETMEEIKIIIPDTTENVIETTESITIKMETETVDTTLSLIDTFNITGYTATGNQTASGVWPVPRRTVAMNTNQIRNYGLKYGDKIHIDGYEEEFVLEDCGCPWGTIDIFFDTEDECYQATKSNIAVYKILS